MKVSLVGAGPGDPGLITVRGRALVADADVIIYDALASKTLLAYAKKGAELIYVGKIACSHALPQGEINKLLAEKARANGGQNVVRLKGGDPYIFGRGGEEAEYLASQKIAFEEIPGISSAIAAPAYAGIPLTHRDFTSSVTILTGHEHDDKAASAHNWKALVDSGSTLSIVMGMANLEHIVEKLIDSGMDPRMPAAIVFRGTTPFQKVVYAELSGLSSAAKKACLGNPAVIVVGKVVSLHNALDWFSKKPLLGRAIVVTRAREQASGMATDLQNLGAYVLQCPTIVIEPLGDYSSVDKSIAELEKYAWIIFTSVNGVSYFWQRLEKLGKDSRVLHHAKVAAIGPGTAEALAGKGILADFIPHVYVAEEVARGLIALTQKEIQGMRFLLPRAEEARMALPKRLKEAGAIVDIVPVYKTVRSTECVEELNTLLAEGKVDCVTFGSSSTARNFFSSFPAFQPYNGKPVFAAIGPITAQTLAEFGYSAVILPKQHTIPAMIEAIVQYFSNTGEKTC